MKIKLQKLVLHFYVYIILEAFHKITPKIFAKHAKFFACPVRNFKISRFLIPQAWNSAFKSQLLIITACHLRSILRLTTLPVTGCIIIHLNHRFSVFPGSSAPVPELLTDH